MLRLLPAHLVLVLWVYCLVEVIGAREDGVRHLAKRWWIVIVLLFPLAGSLAWLVAGRPSTLRRRTRSEGAAPGYPEYDRPGRFAASDPSSDEEFLRKVRERAEEQRRHQDRYQEPSAEEA